MNDQDQKRSDDNVEDSAAYWVVRLSAPDCSPQERHDFEAWCQEDPIHQATFDRMWQHYTHVDQFASATEVKGLVAEALNDLPTPFWQRPLATYAALAASLVLMVGAGLMVWGSPFQQERTETAPPWGSFQTATGERSTIPLPDGSKVTLNTNSRLEVAYSQGVRTLRLVQGQALFDVAKDENRPFIVEASGKQVMALGTLFDVRIEKNNYVQVTLVEGRVRVQDMAENENAVSVGAIDLSPGEKLTIAGYTSDVEPTDTRLATSWQTGQLIFHNKPLEEAITEMNRYSAQKLVLADDPRLSEIKVSGVFDTGRVSTFVNALKIVHPLTEKPHGSNDLILVWQE